MIRRLISCIVVVLASCTVLAACSSSSGGTKTPSSTTTVPPTSPAETSTSASVPAPSSSSAPADPTAAAKAQVLAFVSTYYSTLDKLSSSATLSLNELDDVATDNEVNVEKTALAEHRSNGWVQQGATQLVTKTVTAVDLTSAGSTRPTVQVTTCTNVTDVREVDKTGKSVTAPTRPDFFVSMLTVVNLNYPSPDGWRVSSAPNKGATSCASG
jgi:hypothetical protein